MSLIAQKLISASGATEETDDDFNLVTGLYHFDGSNGAQNNTFLDSSSNGFTVTRAGYSTQGTFSPFSAAEGRWSSSFAATNPAIDYLQVASSSDFAFSTGDYTIEAWVWKNSTGQQSIYDGRGGTNTNRILLYVNSANKLANYINADVKGAATSDFPLGQWVHVALVRSGTTGYMFQNGTQVATWTGDSTDIAAPDTAGLYIGQDTRSGYSYPWHGFISNLRVLKGTALYTGSYTTPTSPLTDITNTKLLTCCSNRHRDKSTSAHVVNSVNSVSNNAGPAIQPFSPFAPSSSYSAANKGGSGYFDGSGDYLSVPNHADLKVGSSDFTLEAWAYINSTDSNGGICGLYTTTGNQRSYIIYQTDSTHHFGVAMSSDGTYQSGSGIDSGVDISGYLKQWVHLALTKSGTNATLYLNGTSIGTTSSAPSTLYASTSPFYVGTMYGASADFDGYIANVRLVKGSIVYASNFTPPTAPLTAITNTEVLFNFTNAAIFDQTGKNNVATYANGQLDTSVKKFGTASYKSDGSGDVLYLTNGTLVPVNYSSFTIEAFIYVNAHANYNNIYTGGYGIQMYTGSGGNLHCWLANVASAHYFVNNFQSTSTVSTTTWTHIALVRDFSAGTLTWFINGTASGQQTSITDPITAVGTVSGTQNIGGYSTAGSYSFNGYIDEMRITNKARYTSNFTAPTEEFLNR